MSNGVYWGYNPLILTFFKPLKHPRYAPCRHHHQSPNIAGHICVVVVLHPVKQVSKEHQTWKLLIEMDGNVFRKDHKSPSKNKKPAKLGKSNFHIHLWYLAPPKHECHLRSFLVAPWLHPTKTWGIPSVVGSNDLSREKKQKLLLFFIGPC